MSEIPDRTFDCDLAEILFVLALEAEIEAMRKDVAMLDEVVHALDIEDREDITPVEAIEALRKRVAELEAKNHG
jgi:hypothetical protein